MSLDLLVKSWWQRREDQPKSTEARSLRISLWDSVASHLRQAHAMGKEYDPLADYRVRWASQWLQLCSGEIKQVDPHLRAALAYFYDPPPTFTDRQHLAAGDHPDA